MWPGDRLFDTKCYKLARHYFGSSADEQLVKLLAESFIAPEFIRQEPDLPFEVRGFAGTRTFGKFLHGAFSAVQLPISHVVTQADKVLVHLGMQGTHTGEFNGTAPTGKRIDAEVMDLFRVENGRLAEHWALMDNLTMLTQIGAVDA